MSRLERLNASIVAAIGGFASVIAFAWLGIHAQQAQAPHPAPWMRPGNVTLSWTPPTEYSDGTPLPVSDIAYYTIESWGATGEQGLFYNTVVVPAAATSAQYPVYCGAYVFTINVTTTMTAKYANSTSFNAAPVTWNTGMRCPRWMYYKP